MQFSRAVSVALLLAAAKGDADAATPKQKVIDLLARLTQDVVEEGKTEAKQFAEYAEFCKKTIDEKQYQIGRATKKIGKLDAEASLLTEDVAGLESDVAELDATIKDISKQIADLEAARKAELETYMTQAGEMDGSISALGRAIATLSASASSLEGKVGLSQLGKDVASILDSSERVSQLQITQEQLNALTSLSNQPGEASKYQYKAGDIVAMLKGLLSTFTANKQTLDMTEGQNKGSFQSKKLNLDQQLTYAKKDHSEKMLVKAAKANKASTASRSRTETANAKDADAAFLQTLEQDCDSKDKISKQRKSTREDELKALKKATEALKEGGVALVQTVKHKDNVQGKKLQVSSLKDRFVHFFHKLTGAPSFVQLRGSHRHGSSAMTAARMASISDMLALKASHLHSPVLTFAALQLQKRKGDDHFIEVRAVISELINRMEKSGSDEADTKAFCDKEVTKHTTDRDDSIAFIETKTSFIDSTTAAAKKLAEEIAQLNQDISTTTAELEETQSMRTKESHANAQTIADATAGEQGTAMALDILKEFYSSNALIQQPSTKIYSGEVTDSSGTSISDIAPTVTAKNYKGSQEKSKGVLGMLDVLSTDYARTVTQTQEAEEKAAEEFEILKEQATKEIESNQEQVAEKTADLKKSKEELLEAEEEKKTRSEQLDMTNDELTKLKGMCVEGDESYEARRMKRQQEIETLEESIKLINDLIKETEEMR
eukprot:TRINITY_DN1990_c0_g2_i1.p1 TRINITY_DN1990_c0_g2~~TRINITY_DN1990_c0_g2_i1.p1  ORF type:complete len:721 (-),score=234.15 TRINITY_DN1990_c0_g2_i1:86-2248(-)